MTETNRELTLKYTELLRSLCLIETPSECKESIDEMVSVIENFALASGYETERIPFAGAGDFLLVKSNLESGKKPVMMMAHMDTVHKKGAFGEDVVTLDGEIMKAPGSMDCKGGIVTGLYVMELLRDSGIPIKLLLTSDEEVSGIFSGEAGFDVMKREARDSIAVLNLEGGSQDEVTVGRKGIVRMMIEIDGVAGHAGNAYFESASAIKEAAHTIIEIEGMSKRDGITFNCGVIHGGTVANVVADKCEVDVDIRVSTLEEMESVQTLIREICKKTVVPNTKKRARLVSLRPPMEITEKNLSLLDVWNACAKARGMAEFKGVIKGGGSDAAYTVMVGTPTLCSCAMIGYGVHTTSERADLSTLDDRVCLLSDVIKSMQC